MHRLAALALLLGPAPTAALAAPQVETLSIVTNGEVTGTVVATSEGNHVAVDYRVDDNGRGPRHHEDIVLGAEAVPVSWTIAGTSLMGGAVDERFRWEDGRSTWSSQADRGSVAQARPGLYIVNDGSPWQQGVYARAALAAPGHAIDVLPGGRLSVTPVGDRKVGAGAAAVPVTVYRIDGVELQPGYVMLDRRGRLFATLGATSVTVRAGYEKEAPGLLALGARLETDRVEAISARVAHRFTGPVRLRNVHVFDPATGRVGPLSTVVMMGERVSAILPGDGGAVPIDETAIEGGGGTVYPGLHDMHSHTTLSSGLFYLAAGITSTRDMGNTNAFLQDLLPRVEAGTVAGPHIVPDGFIEGRSPFSARNGFVIGNLAEGLAAVRWYADRGYFQIKLYNSMYPDLVRPLADEAKRLGMGVTGHVPAFDTPDRVIRDGYDTIAHINQLMLGWLLDPKEDTRTALRLTAMARAADLDLSSSRVQATVKLMQAHHVSLDTTAVIVERLMLSRARTVQAGDRDYLSHMPVGYQRYRQRTFVPLKGEADDRAYFAGFDKVLATMKMLHADGVQLLPGTDDTTGFTLQREVELYTMAGYTPAEALSAATLDCERYFHAADQRGTIERGKIADLVLVAGDPTRDIAAIKRPRLVVRSGTAYFPSEIYAALGIAPFTEAPAVVPPRAAPAIPPAARGAGPQFGWPLAHDNGD